MCSLGFDAMKQDHSPDITRDYPCQKSSNSAKAGVLCFKGCVFDAKKEHVRFASWEIMDVANPQINMQLHNTVPVIDKYA